MDSLLIFMTGVAIIAAGLAFWVNTKMGKNGLIEGEAKKQCGIKYNTKK